MQISRIRLSDKTSRLCFRVQRHLQFLNPSWSLYVAQSPRLFTTYCVCLELRPLPSTGITRFQRYYEPLRHTKAPGLSLAGLQLVIALTTPWGFPCCVRFPCVHAAATTPAQRLGVLFSLSHPAVSAFPERVIGSACASSFSRLARRSLALRPAHSRCHQFVTRIPQASAISSPPQLLRLLPAGAVAGWDLHPLESAALPRRTPRADVDSQVIAFQSSEVNQAGRRGTMAIGVNVYTGSPC